MAVSQGQHFINRRFQSTDKKRNTLSQNLAEMTLWIDNVPSLRDFGRIRAFCLLRRLKPPVNKVPSLRDFVVAPPYSAKKNSFRTKGLAEGKSAKRQFEMHPK